MQSNSTPAPTSQKRGRGRPKSTPYDLAYLSSLLSTLTAHKVHAVKLPDGLEIQLSPFAFNVPVPESPDNVDAVAQEVSDIKNRINALRDKESEDLLYSIG